MRNGKKSEKKKQTIDECFLAGVELESFLEHRNSLRVLSLTPPDARHGHVSVETFFV